MALSARGLEINIPCDAIAISHLVFYILLAALQNDSIDRFVSQFVGKPALSSREKSAESKAQTFVCSAGRFAIRRQPFKKACKRLSVDLFFQLSIRQRWGSPDSKGSNCGAQHTAKPQTSIDRIACCR